MKYFQITSLTLILISSLTFANSLTSTGGVVKFTAVGKPGFLKIRGHSNDSFPTGAVQFKNGFAEGTFDFKLSDLDTGVSLRNDHMKEKYLEIEKYPNAKLSFNNIPIKNSETDLAGDFNGTLILHNVTKVIHGKFDYSAKTKKLISNFDIKVSDFNIDIPKYLGVTVSETVEIEVTLNLN